MSIYDKYEAVIGLEVHAQLSTKSKAYAPESTAFGELPNSNVSPISLGHPGTLPRANKKAFEFAIKLGIAVNADITYENQFARKNYFYADLPKGYQITQDKTPICRNGYITIFPNTEKERKIHLTRIHLEEDAGKSMHDQDPFNTLIDLNRAGVPLVEIVSEPEIKTPEEAYEYLNEVRKLVRYLEICDGNMEEGSLRCDANISVMPKDSNVFGQRTEVKNMNSIRNVQRAIEFEIKRQIDVIESGGKIEMETRSFDAVKGITFTLRSKEQAHDYRYFPEPDLQPYFVTNEHIGEVKKTLPPLPNQLFAKYINELKLSAYDAGLLTENKFFALYFEEVIKHTSNYKRAANWMLGAIKSYLNENAIKIEDFHVTPKAVAELIKLIDDGKISNSIAEQKLFPEMILQYEKSPLLLAEELNIIQESNEDALESIIKEVFEAHPNEVERFKNGEKQLTGFFMGQIMKASKGKADPKKASQLIHTIVHKN